MKLGSDAGTWAVQLIPLQGQPGDPWPPNAAQKPLTFLQQHDRCAGWLMSKPLGATGHGTRPVSSQPTLKEVTLGPIVQSSLPRAQRPNSVPLGGGSQLARPAPHEAAERSLPTEPCKSSSTNTLTHDAFSWRQAVCVLQDSALPALPCPYPRLRMPVPTHPQVLEEESA